MNVDSGRRLLLVCGESAVDPAGFSDVVALSPARLLRLRAAGVVAHRFAQFAIGEPAGNAADATLYHDLDFCLHGEAAANNAMRWAPVAYLQVQLRLSRYCWLKRTLENALRQFEARALTVTSGLDRDLVFAARAVTRELAVDLEIGDGALDPSTSLWHRVRPYGLPQQTDPAWVTGIRWWLRRLVAGRDHCLVQPYWNLEPGGRGVFELRGFRAINFHGRALQKVREMLQLRDPHTTYDRPVELRDGPSRQLQSACWNERFTDDEIMVIENMLAVFQEDFPAPLLDRISSALAVFLRAIGVRRVVLMHDRLDACRMLSHVAHGCGIEVDYLPHGLILENYSGPCMKSPFTPDRMLAWNEFSARSFRKLGWNAVPVRHSQFAGQPESFRNLRDCWPEMRVLILSPEWVCVTQSGEEDCAINDLSEAYAGLLKLGVKPHNILVKYHSSTNRSEAIKKAGLLELKEAAGMDFTLVASGMPSDTLIDSVDLVILGLTSGIFEAVMHGVPMLIFGLSTSEVGSLSESRLPHARTADQLCAVLQNFDNESMAVVYQALAQSLRAGVPVADAMRSVPKD